MARKRIADKLMLRDRECYDTQHSLVGGRRAVVESKVLFIVCELGTAFLLCARVGDQPVMDERSAPSKASHVDIFKPMGTNRAGERINIAGEYTWVSHRTGEGAPVNMPPLLCSLYHIYCCRQIAVFCFLVDRLVRV